MANPGSFYLGNAKSKSKFSHSPSPLPQVIEVPSSRHYDLERVKIKAKPKKLASIVQKPMKR